MAIDRAPDWIAGDAERERRLGRVRPRQYRRFPEPHPLRRSRRAARPADGRRHRPAAWRCWPSSGRRRASAVRRGIAFMQAEQEQDGSWFGRWGTNYVYGTWSALCALNAAGEDRARPDPARRRLAGRPARTRMADGARTAPPTGRPNAMPIRSDGLPDRLGGARADGGRRGREPGRRPRRPPILSGGSRRARAGPEDQFTAVGFPRVFYLRYHGYRGSSRYGRWPGCAGYTAGNSRHVPYGL